MKNERKVAALIAACAVMLVALCGCASVGPKAVNSEAFEPATVIYVVDGDTVCVQRDTVEGPEKVRLLSVNCEESVADAAYLARTGKENTEAGKAASDFTKSLLPKGTKVWLQKDVSDTDKYGRLLRAVWLSDKVDSSSKEDAEAYMVNAILVKNGFAAVESYPPDTAFVPLLKEVAKG